MDYKDDVPWGQVLVKCNTCKQKYFVGRRELRNKCGNNNGWFPCTNCGSHATTWDIEGKGEKL